VSRPAGRGGVVGQSVPDRPPVGHVGDDGSNDAEVRH
jgi:hypothetical protein